MKRENGFTLIELLMTMLILGFVLAGITQTFTSTLTQFKQQGKIAETSIEGIVGLELLRQDLENAGFGLPWRITSSVTYNEGTGAATAYNESASAPPRAFVAGSGVGLNGSDVLIIKATNVARSDAAQKWTYIDSSNTSKGWDITAENPNSSDHVVVIDPGTSDANRRTLVTSSTNSTVWSTTFGATGNYVPGSGYNFVYGLDPDTALAALRMPFNRADYYLVNSSVPGRCAPNTGVLQKTVISQSNGARSDAMPLLDCVADIHVEFRLDRNGDGIIETPYQVTLNDTSTGLPLTSEQIRNWVKEVRVYILAHEGQKDTTYTSPTRICVGELSGTPPSETCNTPGRWFPVTEANYRWKLYTLVIKPKNLNS